MKRSLITFLIILAAASLRAAEPTLAQVWAGDVVPLKLTYKDLDARWRRLTLNEASGAAPFNVYTAMLTGAASAAYYTTGQTITAGDAVFLVAYRPATQAIDVQALMRGGMRPDQLPKPPPPTADTELQLCLINLTAASVLGDIQPFDLERELTGGDNSPEARRQAREEAARAAGLENLQKIGVALLAYAADGNKTLPPMEDAAVTRKALLPYAGGKDIFSESPDAPPYQPNPALSGLKLSAIEKPDETVAFYSAQPKADQRAVLFLDGRVAQITEERWAALKKASRIP